MAEKSSLRLAPGHDALLEYVPKSYKAKTYVEYQGLVFKSLVDTSTTFINSEWELIGDLREVRVRTIADRNALTGSTPTTGTTGIHIPIIDNTNVLVLHAQGDPQVGADKFARYNYNKTTNSFLLLQISTGSTGSNVSDYNLLSNKPQIISGITVTAGNGLIGGGVFSGSVPPTRVTFALAHADTSSQANFLPTGLTYIQKLKFDTYGHVTGGTTSTWVHPDTSSQLPVNGSGFTYIQNIGVDTDGHVTSIGQSTWVHPDTSNQGDVINTGNTVIQSITLDNDGHVIGINSATVSSGGGGGVNFSVAGDIGGNISMPNSGILEITGGTNIQTISSLNSNKVGIRINFLPAGSNNQIQINNNNALGVSSSLTFTGGTTLVTNKLSLTSNPTSASTSNDFLTRSSSGALTRLSFATLKTQLAALPVSAIQFRNASGSFSASANLTFATGSSTLITSNLNIGSNPSTGTTGNVFLTRNSITGNVERVSYSELPAAPQYSVQYNNGNGFGGNSAFTFSASTTTMKLNGIMIVGTTTGTTGFGTATIGNVNSNNSTYTLVVGTNNKNNGGGSSSFISGTQNIMTDNGTAKFAIGGFNTVYGNYDGALGYNNIAGKLNDFTAKSSIAVGANNISSGITSFAFGNFTKSIGLYTVAGGSGFNSTTPILASGLGAINISTNTNAQIAGQGSLGAYAAILGGTDGSIAAGTSAVTILGGQQNKILTGASKGAIVGGITNIISGSSNGGVVLGGSTNKIIGGVNFNAIVGGTQNTISGATDNTSSSIISSTSSKISGGVLRSAIIGGQNILLTGTSQNDNIVVPNLMIWNSPSNATTGDTFLMYNSSTKKITKWTQGSDYYTAFVSPSGSDITGAVGNNRRPFANGNTALAAVKSIAGHTSQGLVVFLPGSYSLSTKALNFDNYINIAIELDNAVLNGDNTSAGTIVTTTAASAATTVNIFGNGKLINAVLLQYTGATVNINVDTLQSSSIDGDMVNVNVMNASENSTILGRYSTIKINRLIKISGTSTRLVFKPMIHGTLDINTYFIQSTSFAGGFVIQPTANNSSITVNVKNITGAFSATGGFFSLPSHAFSGGTIKIHCDNCRIGFANVLSLPIFAIDCPNTKIIISGRYVAAAGSSSNPVVSIDNSGGVTQPITVYFVGGTSLNTTSTYSIDRPNSPAGTRVIGMLGTVVANKTFNPALPAPSIGSLIVDINVP